jgi:hypothetical protein
MSLRRQLDRETKKKTGGENPDTKRKPFLKGTITLENDKPWTILITQYRWLEGPYAPKR